MRTNLIAGLLAGLLEDGLREDVEDVLAHGPPLALGPAIECPDAECPDVECPDVECLLVDPEAVIEGGLHVELTVRMLLELQKQLPSVKRRRIASVWYVSAANTPETVARLGEDPQAGPLTHCQCCFAIADTELATATDVGLERMLRDRALSCLAQLKDISPGCSEIHWIGPMRGPTES